MRFAGYAALFGLRDSGRDVIRKGAFARTLSERKQPIPLFWQHRPDMRIGWVESIAEDAKGLRVVASIDNPDGGAAAALKAGKASGLSFGYRARQHRRDAEGRELTEIDLYEVSLVTHPMQHTARVHMVDGPNRAQVQPTALSREREAENFVTGIERWAAHGERPPPTWNRINRLGRHIAPRQTAKHRRATR